MTIFLAGTTGQSHKQSDFGKLFLAKSLLSCSNRLPAAYGVEMVGW